MSKLHRSLLGAVLSAGLTIGGVANAKELTLCWAAWDPANALVELGKDFTMPAALSNSASGTTPQAGQAPSPTTTDTTANGPQGAPVNGGGIPCVN